MIANHFLTFLCWSIHSTAQKYIYTGSSDNSVYIYDLVSVRICYSFSRFNIISLFFVECITEDGDGDFFFGWFGERKKKNHFYMFWHYTLSSSNWNWLIYAPVSLFYAPMVQWISSCSNL